MPLQIEKANINDALRIQTLISHYAQDGQMLPKSLAYIYEHIRQYAVARVDGQVVGVGALRIFWSDLAEVCSIAVDEKYLRRGIGRQLLKHLEAEAKQLGLHRIFALTYQEEFFLAAGFQLIDRSSLPQKIWQDCLKCPKYEHCDEQAVIKNI